MENIHAKDIACSHGFIKTSCSTCSLKSLCLPISMDIKHIDAIDKIIQRKQVIQAGKHLYRIGEVFSAIYAVRSGSIKTYVINENGVEQITGFYFPGEILGFDGIATNRHGCNVVALEPSTVCTIPFLQMEALARKIPAVQHHFFQVMSRQIETDHTIMFALSKKNSLSKVATFLMSIAKRYPLEKTQSRCISLPMSRKEIANFMGMTIETVSRTLSALARDEVIQIHRRELLIKDMERLERLSHTDS